MKPSHLLIIGVLSLSFTISFLVRSQAADYGFELNEFDPFFNYRATQYIIDNGPTAYFQWDDHLSWYPHGRDVSATSQVMLHLTAAAAFQVFGLGSDLYDFTIIFPVVFGSLSAIAIFALVRVIGGTTAGLFSAMLFSISLPILIRSPIGWFKSEPLGLFFSIIMAYLLLSGLNTKNRKIAFAKLVGAGIFTIFSISAWGGNQFFIIPIGLFFIVLPFLRSDHKFIVWAIPLYTITVTLFSFVFERVASNFILGLGGVTLIVSSVFLLLGIVVYRLSSKNKTRNAVLLLVGFIILIPSALLINSESQFLPSSSHRYLNALNPFLTTTDPLVDSVSEHATTTLAQSFAFHSILMLFAGIGIWIIIKNIQDEESKFIKNDMLSFALILGIVGVYVSSTFVRLEVFAAISVILLASLGLTALTKKFFRTERKLKRPAGKLIKISYVAGVIVLLVIPLIPVGANVFTLAKAPPTILNGGSSFSVSTSDWLDSLEWIKNNTSTDAVIASWWDYGYWISTMAERASLADNSTLNTNLIENIAKMLLASPDEAWRMLQEMDADYVLVFVAAQKLQFESQESLYLLQGGGDESKKQWFIRIAGYDINKYIHADGISGTTYFWNETLLGQMFPFSVLGYVNPDKLDEQYASFVPGTIGIYGKHIAYPPDGDGPLRLVYSSPSFDAERIGPMIGIFVYEVNQDYNPSQPLL